MEHTISLHLDRILEMENPDVTQPVLRSINDYGRRSTDKACCSFATCAVLLWIISWIMIISSETEYNGLANNMTVHKALHFRQLRNYNDSVARWNISDCSPYYAYSKFFASKSKSSNDRNEFLQVDKGLDIIVIVHLAFHVFTVDPTYFADCSDGAWFPYNFMLTGFMSIYLLFVAIYLIITDKKMLSKQPSVMVSALLFVTIIEHSSELFISLISSSLWPYDKRLMYWVMPEALALAILQIKMIFPILRKFRENSHSNSVIENDSSAVGSINNDNKKDPTNYKIIPFYYYTYAMIFGFVTVIILKFLVISTIIAFNKIGWANRYFLLLLVCSLYIGRTIYYHGLLMTSYATNKSIDSENFTLKDLKRAKYVINEYHYGTACFHALPCIFKPSATLELEKYGYTREDTDPKKFFKLRNDFSKYYRLSLILTATHGYYHSKTVKIVSQFILTTPMHEYFSSFGNCKLILYGLLLPTNFLTHVLYWHYGFFDANLAETSWTMYLTIALTFNVVMQFFKVVSDTVGIRMYNQRVIQASG